MRRGKECDGTVLSLGHGQPIAGAQDRLVTSLDARQSGHLRPVMHIAPGDARQQIGRETFQSALVFVCHRRFIRLRDGFLPEQVRPTIHGELQSARKDSHREAGEANFQTGAVCLHFTTIDMIRSSKTADLVRVVQRRVPKNIPAFFFGESVIFAANAGRHAELRCEIPAQEGPFPAFPPRGQLTDNRGLLLNRKRRAELLAGFTVPLNEKRILVHARLESRQRPVLAEVAVQPRATQGCCWCPGQENRQKSLHARLRGK